MLCLLCLRCETEQQVFPELLIADAPATPTGQGGAGAPVSMPSGAGEGAGGTTAVEPPLSPTFGDAGAIAPSASVLVQVVSVGATADQAQQGNDDVTGSALITRDGATLFWGVGGVSGNARGITVARLDNNGNLLDDENQSNPRTFDLFSTSESDQSEASALTRHLQDIPDGVLTVLVVADEAGLHSQDFNCVQLDDSASQQVFAVLRELGSEMIDDICYRDSWAMATIMGQGVAVQEDRGENEPAILSLRLPLSTP